VAEQNAGKYNVNDTMRTRTSCEPRETQPDTDKTNWTLQAEGEINWVYYCIYRYRPFTRGYI